MENMEGNKVDLRKLNILGGTGLLLLGLKYFLPASFLVGLAGLVLEAVVMYKYSKILKNSKIWKSYLFYLVELYTGGLILFGFKGVLDELAKVSTNIIFGLVAFLIITTALFYRKAYKELGLSMRHNYFVKASDFALILAISVTTTIFTNPGNPYVIDVGVYLGQFILSTIFAIGYFTAPKELYLEEKKEEIKSEVNKYETNQMNFAELRDDEPIVVLKNNFNLKAILLKLFIALLMILVIFLTYKAFTDPLFFIGAKGERTYYILLVLGIPLSIALLNLSLALFNLKYIQVYKDKIIQKSFIKWLPPFDKSINLDQKNLKIKISFDSSAYHIVFTERNYLLVGSFLFNISYCNFFYPKAIHMFFNIKWKSLSTCSSRDKILKFIDFLLERIKETKDREKLEKLKQEVLKWDN
jgi:uncharacterized membrane protein